MTDSPQRLILHLAGLVQGVGFRPYVFRLASELGLSGWVANTPEGVTVEIEGEERRLRAFLDRLPAERPPLARIDALRATRVPLLGGTGFVLRHSETAGARSAHAPADTATCPACLRELFDPKDRRYRYPFVSCTDCGPRWSILESLPFDRERTAMRAFPLCPACRAEYENPADRRFHAQTHACPACGPQLALWDGAGRTRAAEDAALVRAVDLLRAGAILALKGVGGFQLLVDAGDAAAVARLRERKARPAKPLAVMVPSLEEARDYCEISALERDALASPAAPIVLLKQRTGGAALAPAVAPGNPYLGILRPYSPLHHLLLADFGAPLVCTSGNLSGEPISIDEAEALHRLSGIADAFLVHDRPILRALDDSVVRVIAGQATVLRRARGYEPLLRLNRPLPALGAVGGHLKNTVALAEGTRVVLSQHLGDLDSAGARAGFRKTVDELRTLFGIEPARLVCDLHPDYASTRYAEATGKPLVRVQHHHAHVLSGMAEHGLEPPVLGLAWDGVGLGTDGTLWGGEFLAIERQGFRRVAGFRPFPLPGGEAAVREPRRAALGLLYALWGAAALDRDEFAPVAAFTPAERRTLAQLLVRGLNAPASSGVGRLFDAVAALLGLRQVNRFEGEAAMALEFAAEGADGADAYPFELVGTGGEEGRAAWIVDWGGMIRGLLDDLSAASAANPPLNPLTPTLSQEERGKEMALTPALSQGEREESRMERGRVMAARFHRTLADIAVAGAEKAGIERVVLSGGVFQNRLLTEWTVSRLETAGFTVYRQARIPPNDGGLALGQLWAVALAEPPRP
jgi:hydrogenase maturation protein HypF